MERHKERASDSTEDLVGAVEIDALIASLGVPGGGNEYEIKPDQRGVWWIYHKQIGSGEPVKQWIKKHEISRETL